MIALVSCAAGFAPGRAAAAQDYAPELTATLTAGGTMIDNAYSGGLSVGVQTAGASSSAGCTATS
jgi:hypothetical protein